MSYLRTRPFLVLPLRIVITDCSGHRGHFKIVFDNVHARKLWSVKKCSIKGDWILARCRFLNMFCLLDQKELLDERRTVLRNFKQIQLSTAQHLLIYIYYLYLLQGFSKQNRIRYGLDEVWYPKTHDWEPTSPQLNPDC